MPTHARPRKLCACLGALAQQTADPARYEVLVGFDGPDEAGAAAARDAWASTGSRAELTLVHCPREGYNAARNRLLERASARIALSLNDDVIPAPGLVEAHARAQDEAAAKLGGPGAVISGRSPWVIPERDTLFDRLIRETAMIFFAAELDAAAGAAADRWRNWGFRHAWGLNMSAPLDLVRSAGGWTAFPLAYGYDDIELAWRLQQRGLPVLHRPEAEAAHDHRYLPRDVLARERKLGQSAWLFAQANPAFGRDLFGRDITSDDELDYARQFVAREARDAERLRQRFLSLAELPADVVGSGPHAAAALDALCQQHTLLKRWEWRSGLMAASGRGYAISREC
jgi:GT2 family glycosyltransferase